MNFNEVCKSASLQVASGFCNEDLRPAPKIFRLAAMAIKDLSMTSVHRINLR